MNRYDKYSASTYADPWKLPFNELNAALASKQATYDKNEADVLEAYKLFPEAGYLTVDRAEDLKREYTSEFDSMLDNLKKTGQMNNAELKAAARRLINDPEYKTVTEDFKVKEGVTKMMAAGNFPAYVQRFYDNSSQQFIQTQKGESFGGDWYRAVSPNPYQKEFAAMTDFNTIKTDIEKSTGRSLQVMTDPITGEAKTFLVDGKTREIKEELTPEMIKKYLTADNAALLQRLYGEVDTQPGTTYRKAKYEQDTGQPYEAEGAFFKDLLTYGAYNEVSNTAVQDISKATAAGNSNGKSGKKGDEELPPPNSFVSSAFVSFNLPENVRNYSSQKQFLQNFNNNLQVFKQEQQKALSQNIQQELGLDPTTTKINTSFSHDYSTNKVNVDVNINGTPLEQLDEPTQIAIKKMIVPYEQAVSSELSTRFAIQRIHQQAGLLDANGNPVNDPALNKMMDDYEKKIKYYKEKYKSEQPAVPHKVTSPEQIASFKAKNWKKPEEIEQLAIKSADSWLDNEADKGKVAQIKKLNEAMSAFNASVVPATSLYVPSTTTDGVRINKSILTDALFNVGQSNTQPTYRSDGKPLESEDLSLLMKALNLNNDPNTKDDDVIEKLITSQPGLVSFRIDPNNGLVMDLSVPTFTRGDASKINKLNDPRASVVEIPLSSAQQDVVKGYLGMSGQDIIFHDQNMLSNHFYGNNKSVGNLADFTLGKDNTEVNINIDPFNTSGGIQGQSFTPAFKVNYKGLAVAASKSSPLRYDTYKIALFKNMLDYVAQSPENPQLEQLQKNEFKSKFLLTDEEVNYIFKQAKSPKVNAPVEQGKTTGAIPTQPTQTVTKTTTPPVTQTLPKTKEEAVAYIENDFQKTFTQIPKSLTTDSTNATTVSPVFAQQLVPALETINNEFKDKGWSVKVHQGARSLAEQQQHLKAGNSTIPVSLHNIGGAVDLAFYKDGKLISIGNKESQSKETKEMLESIGSRLEQLGMTWGGRWSVPYDPWHVQGYTSTKEYLLANPDLKPILKNFLSDYKATYTKTKEPKLKELIEYLES